MSTSRSAQATDRSSAGAVLQGPGCIARIQSMRANLTRGQLRVADAILVDPQAVILASGNELAARASTSEAAVSRFVRVLGYGSYAEFKLALSRDLVGTTEAIQEDVQLGDTVQVVAEKVAAANVRAIDDTMRGLDMEALEAAARALMTTERVAFFGFGGSAAVARDARHHFLRTAKEVVLIDDTHEQAMWATTARPGDVVVLFSHTGTSRDLCDIAEIVRDEGATVVSITNHGVSPLTKLADISLHTSSRETRYREESVSSRIAAMTLVDILYVVVAMQSPDAQAERREKIRKAIVRKRA